LCYNDILVTTEYFIPSNIKGTNVGVNVLKFLLHAVFIILIALVTFFGLGPVLFADGVLQERLVTAAIVVVIYIILAILYRKSIQWVNRK